MSQTISYKDAGVDIDAGNALVEGIKPLVKSTFDANVIGGIGSFAGAYALPSGFKEPVILGATDGVGTKLRLAIDSGRYDSVGIDLVAMCVNDLICNHATPIFFLDYYATGKLEVENATQVIKGIAEGCKQAECALIGGETAEMPGMYHAKDFDLAGFAVGIAERADVESETRTEVGDLLVALPSSGAHSNGYSLLRKILFEERKMSFEEDFMGRPLIETLLEPTKIYVKDYKALRGRIHSLAHITGGGIVENLPRVFGANHRAVIEKSKIPRLPLFDLLSEHLEESEAYRTFNMGAGMILTVPQEHIDEVLERCDGVLIGEVIEGEKGVELI